MAVKLDILLPNGQVLAAQVYINDPVLGPIPWDGSSTPAVGGATAANQTTEITKLTSIDTKLTNPIPVTGTFFQTTQPVSGTINPANITASGNLTASAQSVQITLAGEASVVMVWSGSASAGTITFQASPDSGTTWVTIQGSHLQPSAGTPAVRTSIPADGSVAGGSIYFQLAGMSDFRVLSSTWGSGTVTVKLSSSSSAPTQLQLVALHPSITSSISGSKSNNLVAPGTTNLGTLPAIATAAAPTYTESLQVGLSTDLVGSARIAGNVSIKGGASAVLADVGANTKGQRIEERPIDVGALGSYKISTVSGTMAAGLAGGSPIYSCRWGDATRTMLLHSVRFLVQDIGAFTSGNFNFDIIIARAFTASDTGGTSILPTTNSQKKRTSFGTTLITDLRQSSTATLTAGTRTLDAQPIAQVRGFVPATATGYMMFPVNGQPMTAAAIAATGVFGCTPIPLWEPTISNSWPLTFVQNEGFIIRATVPATGTWLFVVEMDWSEVLSTAGYN